jgi:hypothetical protein
VGPAASSLKETAAACFQDLAEGVVAMRLSVWVLALAICWGGGVSAMAAEKQIPFPQPRSTVPGSFSPLIINAATKDKAGKPHRHRSPVAEFGLKPVVLVFARNPDDEVVPRFLKELEAKVAANQAKDLCAAAVFLCHDDKRQQKDLKPEDLIAVVNDQENVIAKLEKNLPGLRRVLIGIDSPGGPKGYNVGERDYVMVVLYDKFKVQKSFIFGIGDSDGKEAGFDAKASAGVLKAIDQWMGTIKARPDEASKSRGWRQARTVLVILEAGEQVLEITVGDH